MQLCNPLHFTHFHGKELPSVGNKGRFVGETLLKEMDFSFEAIILGLFISFLII